MKRLSEIPDRIVLSTSSQNVETRTSSPIQNSQIRITSLSSKEVLDKIPMTIYTQRAKR